MTSIDSQESKQPQSQLTSEQNMTEFQALHAVGFLKPIDYIFAVLLILTLVTGVYWAIFAGPTAIHLIALSIVAMFTLQLWIMSVVFRVGWFVLQTRATIEMSTADAARLAAAYLQTGGKS